MEDAQRAVADGQQGEGQDQRLSKSHSVSGGAGKEGNEVDPPAEETGDDTCLDVVESDDSDQIGP